jgi:GDPmannose 4,6-dehydratase
MPKVALITGIMGQDGAYLTRHLLNQGYIIWGARRRSSQDSQWRLEELGILGDVQLIDLDLLEMSNIIEAIRKTEPDEIYNLAAQSYVAVSFSQPVYTSQVNAISPTYLLESIRVINPKIKFYQASTSEMFGNNGAEIQNEESVFKPESPYAISKLFSHWMTVNYRKSHDLFSCSGILFNHESPFRGLDFVTRKITSGFSMIKANKLPFLELGNVDAMRDWGHAADYISGMHAMLQQPTPDDYVLATGKSHSVREFASLAASVCGWNPEWIVKEKGEVCLDRKTGKEIIRISPKFFRPVDIKVLKGDATKAREILGWQPKRDFNGLVIEMMEADLARQKL